MISTVRLTGNKQIKHVFSWSCLVSHQ